MPSTSHDPARVVIPPLVGVEWVVEALGCDPGRLRDQAALQSICERLLRELELHAVGPGQWHRFPHPGGVTGLYLLTESHLACHTYPELSTATFNLYCCRERAAWPWDERLREMLGARDVCVRSVRRMTQAHAPSAQASAPPTFESFSQTDAREGEA
jgi:S-adenosylmethionine decarboxylase